MGDGAKGASGRRDVITSQAAPGPTADELLRPSATASLQTLDVANGIRQHLVALIPDFNCGDTESLYQGRRGPVVNMDEVAIRELAQLNAPVVLVNLLVPPDNRLEALAGDRKGSTASANDQWRVCFVWTDAGPKSVDIVDYR